jgi:hypothetical protein
MSWYSSSIAASGTSSSFGLKEHTALLEEKKFELEKTFDVALSLFKKSHNDGDMSEASLQDLHTELKSVINDIYLLYGHYCINREKTRRKIK